MTLHKLKVAALQHEQREDWAAAIDLYRQAIREAEGGAEGGDPSLYNRVGDLAHKAGDDASACEAWEQAVHRYADLGFLNSAIALCAKILRLDPQRLHTYLELARLQARKRVLYDVRSNLRQYLDHMAADGRADAAYKDVSKLGEEFPGWRELDLLVDEILGREPATDKRGASGTVANSGTSGLVFLDTAPLELERASEPDVVPSDGSAPSPSVVDDIEIERPSEPDAPQSVEGLVGVAQTGRNATVVRMEGLDVLPNAGNASLPQIEGLEHTSLAPPPPPEVEDAAVTIGGDLVFIPTEGAAANDAALAGDPLGERVAADALMEQGDRAAAIAALDRSLAEYQVQGEWLHAFQVATELIQAEPQSIARHQARVEIAAQMRDNRSLCEAYADLGGALVRLGSEDKAVAVYRRILELDDSNARAREALRAMVPESTAEPTGFIDLGAMLIDDHPMSTRMRTETPDVAPDEDETFRDALAEFKRALDQNLPIEDHQAHYDLGIAFKEMGLLDEAISEFQKALRAPQVRLRTSEALGEVFFDQGRPAVAEAVLRGVENSAEGDAEKIGVLYWLGRALESQGKHKDAVGYYQRIIAVDVAFRDAGHRLTQASSAANG